MEGFWRVGPRRGRGLKGEGLLSLFGRVHAMPSGHQCPLPAFIFNLASAVPGSWPSQCADISRSLGVALPRSFGVCSGSSTGSVHSWFRACVSPRLDQSLRQRLCTAASTLTVSHVDLRLLSVNQSPDHVVHGRSTLPSHARLWGFARWGHDPSVVQLVILATHFLACSVVLLTTAYLRVLLSRTSVSNGVVGSLCSSKCCCSMGLRPLVFKPSSSHNSVATIVAHISFVGQVCGRFLSL